MKRRIIMTAVALILSLALCGCNLLGGVGSSVQDTEGTVGQTLSGIFFDFTVNAAQVVDEYAGLTASEGYRLVDVAISVTNTYGQDIELYQTDFMLSWGDRDDYDTYIYGFDSVDDTMAPDTHLMADGDTVVFHYVFEVPDDADGLEVYFEDGYTDEDDDYYVDEYFYIPLNV